MSKKVLVEEQNRSKLYSKKLKNCEDSNQSLLAANRRSVIIILPKLDEFFELLEPTTSK